MANLDFRLQSNDIYFDNTGNSFVLTSGTDLVAQRLTNSLKLFLNEWFLDQDTATAGFPYYEYVFIDQPNISLIESILRQHILSYPEITKINSLDIEYDKSNRHLTLSFDATTSEGNIIISEVFP